MAEQHIKRLEELQEQTGADSLTEVVRRAIAVYDFACNATENGSKIAILDQEDNIESQLTLVP